MFKRFLYGLILLAALAGMLVATPSAPVHASATWTVDTLVDENDHSCIDGDCSLRDALELASPGDTIEALHLFGMISLNGMLDIDKDITIIGSGMNNLSISGGNIYRVLFISGPFTVVISNLTIEDGHVVDEHGAGIKNQQGILTLNSVAVINNHAVMSVSEYLWGGGIYNLGSLTMNGGVVSGNSANAGGGGIYSYPSVTVSTTLIGTVIDNNQTYSSNGYGAGLALRSDSSVYLDQVVISNNHAPYSAGGIGADTGLTITNSLIVGNSTDGAGGGLQFWGDNAVYNLANVTITGNTAGNNSGSGSGGGVDFVTGSTGILNLNNVTITNNTQADASGGGGGININGTVNVKNSILAGNVSNSSTYEDCYGTINSEGYNLIQVTTGCTINGDTTGNVTGLAALLNPLADNGGPTMTHSLQASSPALNAGNNATCAAADQRGIARPQGETCDMGAFEDEHPIVLSITRADPNPTALSPVDFTVVFSEDVNGVETSDFDLAMIGVSGAFVSGVSGSNDTYTVTIDTGIGNGSLGLNLVDDNSITDAVGNPLGGSGTNAGDFTGEVYDVAKTAPALLFPVDGSSEPTVRSSFDWTDFAGAVGYNLQAAKSSSFSRASTVLNKTVSVSQYDPTANLPANTLIYWRVRAKVGGTWGAWSTVWTFTTGNPPSVPTQVSPASNGLVGGPSPLFDWKDSTVNGGAVFDHYQLQIARDSAFNNMVHDHNISGAANSSDNDAILDPATTYYWRVRSFAADGDYSAWSTTRSLRVKLDKPVLLTPADLSIGIVVQPAFSWTDVIGATGYTIQISKSLSFGYGTLKYNPAGTTFSLGTNLASATKYYWRVRANGGSYGPSDWSIVFSFTTQ